MFIKCPFLEHSREEDDECWIPQALWPKRLCFPLCKALLFIPAFWALCTSCVLPPAPVSGWALPRHCCASGCAFYWYSVFCAVLLWPILKEVCLALAVVLNRSETANGLICNIIHHNDTFSTDFSGLELIWSFPSIKVKLNSVSLWMKSQGLAALAMAQEGPVMVLAKESHGAHRSLAAGSVSEYLDTSQGGSQPFIYNFSEVYSPSAATSQARPRAALS